MYIVRRGEWGARYENGFGPASVPFRELWLHHSVTSMANGAATIREIEQIGENRFSRGISYTWLITPDGTVYEGHSVDRQGAHTGGRNDRSRAICYVGNYDEFQPTESQVSSTVELCRYIFERGWAQHLGLTGGHRDLKATACPGRYAYARIPEINRRAQEDNMPSAQEIVNALLSTKFDMGWTPDGSTETHKASLRTILEWTDLRHQDLAQRIEKLEHKLDEVHHVLTKVVGPDGRRIPLHEWAQTTRVELDKLVDIVEGLQ